jgi:hypothetical protein
VKLHAWMAIYAVAGFLLVIGLVLMLAVPAAGILVLLLAGLHYLAGHFLRAHQHRRVIRRNRHPVTYPNEG